MLGLRQSTSPKRLRRGIVNPWARKVRTTWLGPAHLEEGGKDQLDALWHLDVGVLLDHPACITLPRPTGKVSASSPRSALLMSPAVRRRRKVCSLSFRDLAFEAEQKTPIGGGGVIDAVLIGNQTVPEAAKGKARIPVRAVAREPCDIEREDHADLAECDPGEQALEAFPVLGARGCEPEVSIDDLDAGFRPSQLYGAAAQCVLQAQALLMGKHRVRARWTDVDDRPAGQMPGGDEIRAGHG